MSSVIGLDSENTLSLDPRLIAEWRPSPGQTWGIFGEFGTVHLYNRLASNAFFNADRNANLTWRHALRGSLGVHFPIADSWDVSARGGVIGGEGEPIPHASIGVTARFP